jgi:uncharacterized protein YegP (UPF0339 family)
VGKTTVRGLGLFAALAALTVATGPGLVAQDAKKKKDDPKTSASKATIKVGEGKDGKFRFMIYDADDVFLGMSGPKGFDTKADAVKGIEAMKAALASAKVIDKPKDDADEKDPPKKEKEKAKPKEAK